MCGFHAPCLVYVSELSEANVLADGKEPAVTGALGVDIGIPVLQIRLRVDK